MADLKPSAPAADARVSTGSPGLDRMLEGGLVAHRPYLVVGPSGTGKTTLALQFLCEGVRRHERVLLVTLEEPPNEARLNHRALAPDLDKVEVFDAIPDIMRYERVPFKDIASVRYSQPFGSVSLSIRQSPELASVEVTLTALEQMLRTEVIRKGYTRLAIDSLTALQYFCMKGFDPVGGSQAFLRFLSDLRVTTILTVESPLEDVETPERALARGEIRLFRWEHDNKTVRAIGVEKFRGSPHDVRLHPYRIGPRGIDINLELTISRDTRQIIEPLPPALPWAAPTPLPLEEVFSPVDPLAEEVRDLVTVGAELGPVRTEIEAALGALAAGDVERSRNHISLATAQAIALAGSIRPTGADEPPRPAEAREAYERIVARGEAARAGVPPTRLPSPKVLEVELEWVLSLIPRAPPEEVPEEVPPTPEVAETSMAEVAAEVTVPPELAVTREEESAVLEVVPVVSEPPAAAVASPPPPSTVAAPSATSSVETEGPKPSPASPLPQPLPSPPEPAISAAPALPPPPPPPPPAPPPPFPTAVRSPPPMPVASVATVRAEPAPPRVTPPLPATEARPPLPTLTAAGKTSPFGYRRAPEARPPTSVAPTSPGPVVSPPASPPSTVASSAVKRKRKAAAPRRKRAPPVVGASQIPGPPVATIAPLEGIATESRTGPAPPLPSEPGAAEPAPAARPKKRTARKRKAPPVVAASPAPVSVPLPQPPSPAPESPAAPAPTPEAK